MIFMTNRILTKLAGFFKWLFYSISVSHKCIYFNLKGGIIRVDIMLHIYPGLKEDFHQLDILTKHTFYAE